MSGKPTYEELESRISDLEKADLKRKQAEVAQRESEERFNRFLRNAPLPYQSLDENGNLLEVNQNLLDLLGYTREELIGRNLGDFLHPDWVDHFKENFPRFKAVGEVLGVEFEMIKKDGTTLFVSFNGKIQRDDQNNFQRTHCIFQDITESRRAENSLRASEKKYRTLFENMAQGVFYQNAEGVLTDYNNAALEMFGLPPDQFMGKTSLDPQWKVISEDGTELPGDKHPSMVALQTGKSVRDTVVGVYNPRTKNIKWLVVNAIPQSDKEGGKPNQVFVTLQDITDRKQSEEALRQSEEKYHKLYEDAAIGIFHSSLEGRFLDLNPSLARMLGYETPQDVVGSIYSIAEQIYVEPQDRDKVIAQSLAKGETVKVEKRYRRKDGSEWNAYLHLRHVFDSNGQILCLEGFVEDITDRKRMEDEREVTIEFLRFTNDSRGTEELIHAATAFIQKHSGCEAVGIRLKEKDDYPYYETRGFPEEFVLAETQLCARDEAGRPICDSAGNPVLECMCGNVICGRFDPSKPFFTAHGSFWSNCTTELLAFTSAADRQSRTRNRCNGEGYESVALIPLQLGMERLGLLQLNDRSKGRFNLETIALFERLAGYLAVAIAKFRAEEKLQALKEDLEMIVEKRTHELQETHEQLLHAEKLSAIGGLSASIAHEFNNPLQGVINVIKGIKQRATMDEEDAQLVDSAIIECDRMKNLIKSLQDFNRPTSGRMAPMDIHAAIDSILMLSKKDYQTTGITIETNYADLPQIKAVADQIKQVLLNLLNNAAYACSRGDRITISTDLINKKNIRIKIQDTGKGIKPEHIDKIFDPFFTTKPAKKGTGLGLSISYGIIKKHGGWIDVKSELGKGTIFTITLPNTGVISEK